MSGPLGATVAGTEGNLSNQEPSCAQHAQHTCPPTTADALQGAALSMQYQWPWHTCRLDRQTNAASPIVFDMSHDKKTAQTAHTSRPLPLCVLPAPSVLTCGPKTLRSRTAKDGGTSPVWNETLK